MSALKAAWITEQVNDLVSLSLESAEIVPEHMRLKVVQRVFPERPTTENPLRHVIVLSLLSKRDIEELRNVLDDYLYCQGMV